MSEPINENDQRLNRQLYYQKLAENLLNAYGLTFEGLLQRNPELSKLESTGDELISSKETTGYNLITTPDHMDILSENKLLFFNLYADNTAAIGSLISDLIDRRLITESQVRLGVKASKVVYDNWIVSSNEKVEKLFSGISEGKHNPTVSKTVEVVITFMVSGVRAKKIVRDIIRYSSWEYPDLRATISLEPNLPRRKFTPVQANVLNEGSCQIIALRKYTKLDTPWRTKRVVANKELARYLTKYEVKP